MEGAGDHAQRETPGSRAPVAGSVRTLIDPATELTPPRLLADEPVRGDERSDLSSQPPVEAEERECPEEGRKRVPMPAPDLQGHDRHDRTAPEA